MLNSTFSTGTTSYDASMANNVNQFTIIPTLNEANSTYEIHDGSGNALTDSDSVEDDSRSDPPGRTPNTTQNCIHERFGQQKGAYNMQQRDFGNAADPSAPRWSMIGKPPQDSSTSRFGCRVTLSAVAVLLRWRRWRHRSSLCCTNAERRTQRADPEFRHAASPVAAATTEYRAAGPVPRQPGHRHGHGSHRGHGGLPGLCGPRARRR